MFDPFCAKVLAGIGDLPDTVHDRSIPIRLKRKTTAERVDRFRHKQAAEAFPLRQELQGWAEAHRSAVEATEPAPPDELSDRQQDAWEILLAIADTAGLGWADKARAAAIELAKDRVDGHASWGIRLLADLQTLFLDKGGRHLGSQECVAWLNALEEAPWSTWNRGYGANSYNLNKLLEPYEIRTRDVRIPSHPNAVKGLYNADLQEAFRRWLERADEEASADTATSRQPAPPSVPGRSDNGEPQF